MFTVEPCYFSGLLKNILLLLAVVDGGTTVLVIACNFNAVCQIRERYYK